jgi:putative beta-lysine N-acetyltransferase
MGSVVQHGPHNDRVYLMRLRAGGTPGLVAALDALAERKRYGKIFAKIPATAWPAFRSAGYVKEAVVPGFFAGKTDGYFVSRYLSENRNGSLHNAVPSKQGASARKKTTDRPCRHGADTAAVFQCRPSDAVEMSGIYRRVFASYPFPIHDPAYLRRMMTEGGLYFGFRIDSGIAALAAAEIDAKNRNAEMTDFATLPEWRGQGFAGRLLDHMERKVRRLGVETAYTIARATSAGMNAVFSGRGYRYAGLLKNNSQICGRIQSMTVWYRRLT